MNDSDSRWLRQQRRYIARVLENSHQRGEARLARLCRLGKNYSKLRARK